MGKIVAHDKWQGETTRIYVEYPESDQEPDWGHDPDIADVLAEMRGSDNEHLLTANRYYLDVAPGMVQWVIARTVYGFSR